MAASSSQLKVVLEAGLIVDEHVIPVVLITVTVLVFDYWFSARLLRSSSRKPFLFWHWTIVTILSLSILLASLIYVMEPRLVFAN